jgi:hypothetical protein
MGRDTLSDTELIHDIRGKMNNGDDYLQMLPRLIATSTPSIPEFS